MSKFHTLYSKKKDITRDFLLMIAFLFIVVICLSRFFSQCNQMVLLHPEQNFGFLNLAPVIFLDCISAYFMLSIVIRRVPRSNQNQFYYYDFVAILLLLPIWLLPLFYSANLTWSSYESFRNPSLPPFIFSVICLMIPLYGNDSLSTRQTVQGDKWNTAKEKSPRRAANKRNHAISLWSKMPLLFIRHRTVITDIVISCIYLFEIWASYYLFFSHCNIARQYYPHQIGGTIHLYPATLLVCISVYFMLGVVIRHLPYSKMKRSYYLSAPFLLLISLWLIPRFHLINLSWAGYHYFSNPAIVPFMVSIIFLMLPLYERGISSFPIRVKEKA